MEDKKNQVTDPSVINIGSRSMNESAVSQRIRHLEQQDLHEHYPGVERSFFDFTAERNVKFKIHLYSSIGHMIKGCIGAGLLGVPYAYMQGGQWFSLAFTILTGILVFMAGYMLVNSAHRLYNRLRVSTMSYSELAEKAAGAGPCKCAQKYKRCIRITIDALFYCEQIGSCCIFILFITTTLKHTVETLSPQMKNENYSMRIYIMFVFIPLCIICVIRSMKIMVPLSFFCEVIVVMIVIGALFYGSIADKINISHPPVFTSLSQLVKFTAILIYAVDGITVVMSVENHMDKPKYFKFLYIICMSIVTFSMSVIGFFGYSRWGSDCLLPVTLNFPNHWLAIVVMIVIMVALCGIFFTRFWVPFKIMCFYIKKGRPSTKKGILLDTVLRILLLLGITLIALLIPSTIDLIIIIGNVFLTILTFILPPFIHTLASWKDHPGGIRWIFIKNVLFIMFGFTIIVLTIVHYIFEIMKS